jgi:EAL domain-containing protein (putative c-di-GMP-specific phosphodiesterase class I)
LNERPTDLVEKRHVDQLISKRIENYKMTKLLIALRMTQQVAMKTVAEGVEGLLDWHFLRECGCGVVQGYFIGRLMAQAEIPGWIDEWESRHPSLVRST